MAQQIGMNNPSIPDARRGLSNAVAPNVTPIAPPQVGQLGNVQPQGAQLPALSSDSFAPVQGADPSQELAALPPDVLAALESSPADGSLSPQAMQAILQAMGGPAAASAPAVSASGMDPALLAQVAQACGTTPDQVQNLPPSVLQAVSQALTPPAPVAAATVAPAAAPMPSAPSAVAPAAMAAPMATGAMGAVAAPSAEALAAASAAPQGLAAGAMSPDNAALSALPTAAGAGAASLPSAAGAGLQASPQLAQLLAQAQAAGVNPGQLLAAAQGQGANIAGAPPAIPGGTPTAAAGAPQTPEQKANAAALQAAQAKAQKVMSAYPQDDKLVSVTPGKDDLVAQWKKTAEGLVGPGSKSGLEDFLKDNHGNFQELSDILNGKRSSSASQMSGKDFVPLGLSALAAKNPNASFELVGMRKGAKIGSGADSVIIKMAVPSASGQPGPDGQPQEDTKLFAVHMDALTGKKNAAAVREAIVSNPQVAQAFQAAFNKVSGGKAGASAAATLSQFPDFAQGAVAAALMAMPGPAQLAVLSSLPASEGADAGKDTKASPKDGKDAKASSKDGKGAKAGSATAPAAAAAAAAAAPAAGTDPAAAAAGPDAAAGADGSKKKKESLFGGFLQEVDPQSDDALVRADATGLVTGKPQQATKTLVSIAAAESKTGKNFKILSAHTADLMAPAFEQAMQPRGDATHDLKDSDVENEIGTAMQIPPNNKDPKAAVHYTGDMLKAIEPIAKQLRHYEDGKTPLKIAQVPVQVNTKEGTMPQTVFRVETKGGDRFVDTNGRRYESWDDFLKHNQFPPDAKMTYPVDGHLRRGKDGQIAIKTANTPQTVDTFKKKLLHLADNSSMVGGLAIGVTMMLPEARVLGVLAKVLGTTEKAASAYGMVGMAGLPLAGYGAVRSGGMLKDMIGHGQTINPLKDPNARMQDLNFVASTLGLGAFVGLGGGAKVIAAANGAKKTDQALNTLGKEALAEKVAAGATPESLASNPLNDAHMSLRKAGAYWDLSQTKRGAQLLAKNGTAAEKAMGAWMVTSQLVDAANTVNQTYYMLKYWNQLSWTDRMMLGSQMVLYTPMMRKQAKQVGGYRKMYSPSSYREQFVQQLLMHKLTSQIAKTPLDVNPSAKADAQAFQAMVGAKMGAARMPGMGHGMEKSDGLGYDITELNDRPASVANFGEMYSEALHSGDPARVEKLLNDYPAEAQVFQRQAGQR